MSWEEHQEGIVREAACRSMAAIEAKGKVSLKKKKR